MNALRAGLSNPVRQADPTCWRTTFVLRVICRGERQCYANSGLRLDGQGLACPDLTCK
jgi:hypothetical protein